MLENIAQQADPVVTAWQEIYAVIAVIILAAIFITVFSIKGRTHGSALFAFTVTSSFMIVFIVIAPGGNPVLLDFNFTWRNQPVTWEITMIHAKITMVLMSVAGILVFNRALILARIRHPYGVLKGDPGYKGEEKNDRGSFA